MLVVDFGAQYAQLIARRVREAQLYSEIVPSSMSVADLMAKDPAAIILSGGPSSVYADGAPSVDPALFDTGVPVLGICYGFQAMAQALGGRVDRTGRGEYGATALSVTDPSSVLLADCAEESTVWMSHGDAVAAAPDGFAVTAATPDTPIAAFEAVDRGLAGVQFHPEVLHTENGQRVLEHFLYDVARLRPDWNPAGILAEQVAAVRRQVGDAKVICALSGGVDSAVAAAIVHEAVGDQLTCVFVDHGLLRAGEREQVQRDYVAATGVRLVTVDAAEVFLAALAGVTEPEQKRKIIGREFIRAFEGAAADLTAEFADEASGGVTFLVQGTLYPDVVESGVGTGTATIKSHHNVGGLPEDLTFALVEPLRTLFKDEVRMLGAELGLPDAIVHRQPFPGPGLGIRIIGEVTAETVDDTSRRRRDRPRGTHRSRAGCGDLAVPGRAVGRRAVGRRAGRRPVLRASDRAAAGDQRGRHDGGLGAGAVRRARPDLRADHRRGAGGQPGGAGCHQQAARHHRVGVTAAASRPGESPV